MHGTNPDPAAFGLFLHPFDITCQFITDDTAAAAAAAEWLIAGELIIDEDGRRTSPGILAGDTETDYDATLNLDIEVALERVLSVAAAFRTLEGVSPEHLITGDDLPALARDQGIVGIKVYVVDLGYVDAAVLRDVMSRSLMHVYNQRFERKVFVNTGTPAGMLRDIATHLQQLDLGSEGPKFMRGLSNAYYQWFRTSLQGKGTIQLSYRPIEICPELSAEQIAYAASDAIATLGLALVVLPVTKSIGAYGFTLHDRADDESLGGILLDKAQGAGTPVALNGVSVTIKGRTYTGWDDYLKHTQVKARAARQHIATVEQELAGATGASTQAQGAFNFDGDSGGEIIFNPSFDPAKKDQLVAALNRLDEARVREYHTTYEGRPRLFTISDEITKETLQLLGGPLAQAIRDFTKSQTLLQDSGPRSSFYKAIDPDTQRVYPKINQGVAATGRLTVVQPAMQNRDPDMKPFERAAPGKVIAYADASQAELKVLAHIAQDTRMIRSFVDGLDLHTATATAMFQLDVELMQTAAKLNDGTLVRVAVDNRVEVPWAPQTTSVADDDRVIEQDGKFVLRSVLVEAVKSAADTARGRAKQPNFGVPYGMGPAALAVQLSLNGVFTTKQGGQETLDAWMTTYPHVKSFLEARDAYIAQMAANPPACDFDATWTLIQKFGPVTDAVKAIGEERSSSEDTTLGQGVSDAEVAQRIKPVPQTEADLAVELGRDATTEELEAELACQADVVRWVRTFRAPVVVLADGTPFQIASFTLGGRRRLFQVSAKMWLEAQVKTIMVSKTPAIVAWRNEWGAANRVRMTQPDGRPFVGFGVAKAVSKDKHRSLVEHVLAKAGPTAVDRLGQPALSYCIGRMKAAYRNAPIQGSVGDIMMRAYALLDQRLEKYGDRAQMLMTIHDSMFVECDMAIGREVAKILQETIVECIEYFCPSVPGKADAAIAYSFNEKDVVDPAELDAAEAAAAQLAA